MHCEKFSRRANSGRPLPDFWSGHGLCSTVGMVPKTRLIDDYMTPLPYTIGAEQSLAAADERMRQIGVRHLPVLHGRELVGIVSDRDIRFVRELGRIDATRLSVEDVMTPEPFVVGREMPLSVAARTMADRKLGCVVVLDHGRVVGILTTTDALSILADLLLLGPRAPDRGALPSAVRRRILEEHRLLRRLLDEVEELAERALAEDRVAQDHLARQARELYRTLLRHLELEDLILAPALAETGAYGPERVERLRQEHTRQREELREALGSVSRETATKLAESLQTLVPAVRNDMTFEEEELLSASLLKDDPITSDLFSG